MTFAAQRAGDLIAALGATSRTDDERAFASERSSGRSSDASRHAGDRYDLALDRHIDLPLEAAAFGRSLPTDRS